MNPIPPLQKVLSSILSTSSAEFLAIWSVDVAGNYELACAGSPPLGLDNASGRGERVAESEYEESVPNREGVSVINFLRMEGRAFVLLISQRRPGIFSNKVSNDHIQQIQLATLQHIYDFVLDEVGLASSSTAALLRGFSSASGAMNPFQVTLDYLLRSFRLEHGNIWGLHDNTKFLGPRYLTLEAASHNREANYEFNCLPEPDGLVWRALKEKSPKVQEIKNIKLDDLVNKQLFNLYKNRSVFLIRLGDASKPYGVACLAGPSSTNLAINAELVALFESLVGLELASKRHHVADTLISSVHDLFHQEELSVQDLCSLMCVRLREIINCEATSIFLKPQLDVQSERLNLFASDILPEMTPSEELLRFRNGDPIVYIIKEKSLTGLVARKKETIIENSVSQSNRNSHIYREVVEKENDTWIGVPMLTSRNDCIGVIRCAGKHAEVGNRNYIFSSIDYRVLKYAGNILVPLVQLAMASQQAKEDSKQLADRERIREHEMRGPLQLITSNAEFVRRHLTDAGVTSKSRRLENIIANTHLCGTLLASTQLPSDAGFAQQLQAVKLRGLLQIIADVLVQQIAAQSPSAIELDEASLEFRVVSTPFMAVEVRGTAEPIVGHRDLLQRAFYNLASNAVKYADREKPGRLTITLRSHPIEQNVSVTFEDYGIGIPADERDLIFVSGFRGKKTGHRQGQGIGLAMARRIIEKHGGTLDLIHLANPTIFEAVLPEKPNLEKQS